MFHLIYHPNYLLYRFGPNHPFRPERAQDFLELLKQEEVKHKIHKPNKASDEDILLVHSKDYLKRVKKLARQNGALSIDTPLNLAVLEAAYYSIAGTILAANLALEGKRVFNLLGGLHHAGISNSSGFCIFNDHAIAIRKLQQEKRIHKAFVFDVDVHAGQGTQEIFYSDPEVFTLSIHQDPSSLYPGTGFANQMGKGKGEGFNKNIILSPGYGEKEFLKATDLGLKLLNKFKPDLTILVFGADTYKDDPLANINLEIITYQKLGKKLRFLDNLCVLFAGGYSQSVPEIWLSLVNGFLGY